jgi:uncharacterized protein (DUF2336 family)
MSGSGGGIYEKAKALARDGDAEERRDLAARGDVAPEILYYLAEDEAREVRLAVAENAAAPVQSSLLLSKDPDDGVRAALAEKVARLTPDFDPRSQKRAERYVVQTLERLAQDQAILVRRALAETLKRFTNAPAHVIRQLARDVEDEVACVVLEASPLLRDEDLLSIIERADRSSILTAISRRQGLGAAISDAIVASEDRTAVTALLSNRSAQVRESTLDRLVGQAAEVVEWQDPLVDRPELSRHSVEVLAGFVARSLLAKLQGHPALDPESARRVAETVRRRLELEGEGVEEPPVSPEIREARRLYRSGGLDVEVLSDAISDGRRDFAIEGLSLRSEKPRLFVEKVLQTGSAKAVTALAWRAGLNMRTATQAQFHLAGIQPQRALYARDGESFPLSEDEMRWQLEFFDSMVEEELERSAGA